MNTIITAVTAIALVCGTAAQAQVTSAKAHSIPITSLPITITASGTYVFTSDLTWSGSVPAISVQEPPAGTVPVIVDLKGHILSGLTPGGTSDNIGIQVSNSGPEFLSNVIIRNGTITKYGIIVSGEFGRGVSIYGGIVLDNLVLNNAARAVVFARVDNSTVKNCTFAGRDATLGGQ